MKNETSYVQYHFYSEDIVDGLWRFRYGMKDVDLMPHIEMEDVEG